MEKRWSPGRVTRADALVAGAVCLFLLILLPVLLTKPREQSARQLCGANLAQIGKAMLMYARDHNGALPRAGGPTSTWGIVLCWNALTRQQAFAIDVTGSGGSARISSCFYMLVKYYRAPPRLFVCRDDKGATEFRLSDVSPAVAPSFGLADAWDFGAMDESCRHYSYSYHFPFSQHALTTSRDPNFAVAADRNPFLDAPTAEATRVADFKPDLKEYSGTAATARMGNSVTHGRDGQNVLFLDGHVTFEKRSYCGLDADNIYLISTDPQRGSPVGVAPLPPIAMPDNQRDSVLVHDPVGPPDPLPTRLPRTEARRSAPYK